MQYYFWFLKHDEDDVVTLGVKGLCFALTLCVLLWLLSFVLIMIQIIKNDLYFSVNALLFIPMWIGTVISILTTIYVSRNVCKNATLVTRERREYMRASGVECDHEFIDYESLPLCRKLFFLSITIAVSTLVAFFAQIVFYLWFAGVIKDVWNACTPIITLFVVYQVYMYSMTFFSPQTCFLFTLLIIQLILFTLKSSEEIQVSWSVISMPVTVAVVIFFWMITALLLRVVQCKYQLSALQWCSMCGYLTSWCLCVAALFELLSSSNFRVDSSTVDPTVVPVLWTAAIVVFTLSALVILNVEGWRLSVSRGYTEPLPLVLGTEGWTVAGDKGAPAAAQRGWEDTLWLGRVNLARGPQSYRQLLGRNTGDSYSGGAICMVKRDTAKTGGTVDPLRAVLDVMEPDSTTAVDVYLRDSYQNTTPAQEANPNV